MAVLSTLSDPRQQVPVTRQHGRNVLNLTQPRAANEYNTVNQLLFAITLFRDLTEIKWFTTTIFRDQALFTLEMSLYPYSKARFAARNIRVEKALMNLAIFLACKLKLVYSKYIFNFKLCNGECFHNIQ